MASTFSLVLRAIQPQDRLHACTKDCDKVHEQKPTSRRNKPKIAQHTRRGPQRDNRSDPWLWHTTQPRPWVLREQRRVANRRARQARKANR